MDNRKQIVSDDEWSKLQSPHDKFSLLINNREVRLYMWKISHRTLDNLKRRGIRIEFLSPEDIFQELSFYLFQQIVKRGDNFDPSLVFSLLSRHGNYIARNFTSRLEYRREAYSIDEIPVKKSYEHKFSVEERFIINAVRRIYEDITGEEFDPVWLASPEGRFVRRRIKNIITKEVKYG